MGSVLHHNSRMIMPILTGLNFTVLILNTLLLSTPFGQLFLTAYSMKLCHSIPLVQRYLFLVQNCSQEPLFVLGLLKLHFFSDLNVPPDILYRD